MNRDGVVLAMARHRGPRAIAEPGAVGPVERSLLRMTLDGANPAPSAAGLEELPGKVNYFIGKDPKTWRTNIPTYGKVRYGAVYRGIDLVYYGNGRQLEYDFIVAPGADPGVIALAFGGADALTVSTEGDLVLQTRGGDLRLRKPLIYQEVGGAKQSVPGGYVLKGERRVGFQVAAYDQTRPLVIDPVLVYSTYLGGLGEDNGSGITADATGIYVTGLTVSPDFPTAPGAPYQGSKGADFDAFVTKLNPAGTARIYSTYLGGNGTDYGQSIAVDGAGNAYVTGLTTSTDFPVTASAYQATNGGGTADAFLTKLDPSGTDLLYSTYLGGTADDRAIGVAVDVSGNAYVTGQTSSTNFPVSATRYQGASGGGPDAFVAKLNPTASGPASLVYATYLGGNASDAGLAIVVDAAGNATVVGRTSSTDFPMGTAPFQSTNGGGFDVFVAKLGPGGTTLLYATYLGGSGDDWGYAIARDSSGNVYITGNTTSTNFPTTAGAFDTGCGSDGNCNFVFLDAFVAKLNPTAAGAASLVYSTYLGGNRDDEGRGIGVDASGRAHVIGWTDSTDFPIAKAFQPVCGMGCGTGFVDAFVTTLNAAGSALEFSTFLGGSSSDYGIGGFVDAAGNTYVTGDTFSENFPTVNPVDGTWSGNFAYDAFVAKIDNATTSADLTLGKTASPDPATAGLPLTYTLTVTNNGPDPATGVRLIDRMPAGSLSVSSATSSQGACTVANDGFSAEVRCDLGSLAASASATATIVVTPGAAGTITNTATVASSVSDPNGTNNAATRDTTVELPPPPTITSFTPGAGPIGASVTITGEHLASASFVTFNGSSATTFTAVSDTQITATVPSGATTGPISVTTLSGTATSATDFTVGLLPTITSISPTSGAVGISVTINGTNFADATSVTFNGASATFSMNTGTRITAVVPPDATTGPIRVTTPIGTAASAVTFTVPPRITGLTPPSGIPGSSVAIAGANFVNVTSVRFNGINATFVVDSSTQITATVPANATTGAITVTTSPGGTGTSATSFVVAPRITSFTPSTGASGASVTINGANLANASSVTFNTTPATITLNTPVKITAIVPAAATTGRIAVTTAAGTATSATNFTVILTPTISSFSPAGAGAGVPVTINGTNFTGATSVKLNGLTAPFTVNSSVKITMTVPGNGTTGRIVVTTPGGIATSATDFTVAPRITSFAPANGVAGTSVTINGANFAGASAVTFNGTAGAFIVNTSIKITATVPAGAITGKIAVATSAGTAISAGTFTVKPTIASFNPGSGVVGTSVTITGTAFTGATSVKLNGLAAAFHVDSSSQITATVPANATSGTLSVTTPAGTATSTTSFIVAPRITSFTPAHGGAGASVAINGANFTGASFVKFNGISASYVINSGIKITSTVPAGASTGKISVTTTAGTAMSAGNFTIP